MDGAWFVMGARSEWMGGWIDELLRGCGWIECSL